MSDCAWCGAELDSDKGGTQQVPSIGRCHQGTSSLGIPFHCATDALESIARKAREAQKASAPGALRKDIDDLEQRFADHLKTHELANNRQKEGN